MIKVLIVEDEKPIANLIRLSLNKEGYACTCAFDGLAAVDLLEKNIYDLILLDVMLPHVDGFELLEYIRPLEVPVIFITAKDSVLDKVKGLRLGAEDYIVKPFEIIELLARINVVLRRYQKCDMVLNIGGLKIDTCSRQVWQNMKCYCFLLAILGEQCIEKLFTNEFGVMNIHLAARWLIYMCSECAKKLVGKTF